jgi:hypothetical protein
MVKKGGLPLRQILLGLLLCTLLVLNTSLAAAAEPGGTSTHVELYPDTSGRLDMRLVKSYSGIPSPFQDIINLPNQDWYLLGPPLVETEGAVTADAASGGIRVEGTGPGRVTVSYSTRIYGGMTGDQHFYNINFLLHQKALAELGSSRLNVQATLPPGAVLDWKHSGLAVDDRTTTRPLLIDRTFGNNWQATAVVEPNHFASVQLAFRVRHNRTPGWLSIAGFTLAGGAFALALYNFCRQKQRPTGL